MTIGTTAPRVVFLCDGVSTVFPVQIQAYQASDFTVVLTAPISAGGGEVTLVLNSTYTMAASGALQPPQWTMTTTTAYAAGYQLQVFCNPLQQQQTQFVQGQSFPSLAVQTVVDRLTQMVQRLQDQVNRAIRAPDGDIMPSLALPSAALRANLLPLFDANGNLSLSSILPPGQTLSTATLAPFLNLSISAAETLAGVTPMNLSYPVLDIRRYGADPTGVVASDAAMASAVAVCGTSGGRIRAPAGTYLLNNQINLTSKTGILIVGDGAETTSGTPATILSFANTGSTTFILAPSSNGCGLRGCYILPSGAGYSGDLIKCGNVGSDAAFFSIEDCTIGTSGNSTCSYLNLDKTIESYFLRVNFVGGSLQVKGQLSTGGSYSNVITFRDCHFAGSALTPIAYLGDSWTFQGCTFEGVPSGGITIAGAIGTISATPLRGFVFSGNWCGDITGGNGTWLTLFGDTPNQKGGAAIQGNVFGGSTNSVCISLNSISGVQIAGNYFDNFSAGVSFDTATIAGVVMASNSFINVANVIGGPGANIPQNLVFNPNSPTIAAPTGLGIGKFAANGYEVSPNGIIEMWGQASVTAGTPVAVTFATNNGISFPNNIWNYGAWIVTPSSGSDVAYITSPSLTGLTLNVNGTGSATVHWRARGS